MALAPIAAGEVVSGTFVAAAGRDGTLSWTVTSPISAGTVVRFLAVDLGSRSASTGTLAVMDSFNLSPNSETLIAYQGGVNVPTTLITSVSTEGSTPFGLTNGLNAVEIETSAEFRQYVGSRSSQSSFAAYGPLVNNAANWNGPTPSLTPGSGGNENALPNTDPFTLSTSVTGDPHVSGANGINIEFNGKAHANYTLLSAPAFEITMQMAAHGPSEHFISHVGLLFRGAAIVVGPRSFGQSSLKTQLESVGAKVATHGKVGLTVTLCRGHEIAITTHHTTNGTIMNYLQVQVSVPGCHDKYGGVLGQTYQCRWATQQFIWSSSMEESFRVATLTTPTGAFAADGVCADEAEYRGAPMTGSSK